MEWPRLRTRASRGIHPALALVMGCAACRELPAGPARATPIISFTLLAGESTQVATITEAARADSTLPSEPRPIDPARVRLSVLDDAGLPYPLIPLDTAGHYRVSISPRAGATYRLAGTIESVPVAAQTTVPGAFAITTPAGDTITGDDGMVTLVTLQVPLRYDAAGVTTVECRVVQVTGKVTSCGGGSYGSGTLVFLRDPAPGTVLFLAYNRDAAEWLTRATPRGNVTGAFGGFGSALTARRNVLAP